MQVVTVSTRTYLAPGLTLSLGRRHLIQGSDERPYIPKTGIRCIDVGQHQGDVAQHLEVVCPVDMQAPTSIGSMARARS